jgi:hypothetical protein
LALNLRDYSRQRSRWLRNLLIIGRRYGDREVVLQALHPMAIGAAFVLLPFFAGRWRTPGRLLALTLWLTAWQRRIHYVRQGPPEARAVLRPSRYALLALYALVDLLTWARALIETLHPSWRKRW